MSVEKVFFEIDNELFEEETPVFNMVDLKASCKLVGPAMIINQTSTIVIEPDWECIVT